MDQQIKTRQIEQLYSDSKLQFYFAFPIFILYTTLVYDLIDAAPLIIWCVLYNLAIVIRGVSFLKYHQLDRNVIKSNAWLWLHACTSILYSLAQAWLILQFDLAWPTHIQIAFWVLIVSVSSISLKGLSAVFVDYVAFTLPMLLTGVISLSLQPATDYHSLSWMFLFFTAGVYITAYSAYMNNTRRIKYHFHLILANKKLDVLASRDPLTNLMNRRAFDDYYQSEWDRHKRSASVISLLVIDVDYFKQYNDAYGHTAGDDCLIRIANHINESLKRPADKAARYGGEEFVVLLPDTPTQGALEVAERILNAIRHLAIPHNNSITDRILTVSIGLATIDPEDGKTPGDLFRLADSELYKAKAAGRNRLSRYRPDTNISTPGATQPG